MRAAGSISRPAPPLKSPRAELHAAVDTLTSGELKAVARLAFRSTAPDVQGWLSEILRRLVWLDGAASDSARMALMGQMPCCPDCGATLACACQKDEA